MKESGRRKRRLSTNEESRIPVIEVSPVELFGEPSLDVELALPPRLSLPSQVETDTIAQQYHAIIAFAERVAARNPKALPDLVTLLGKKLQADFINDLLVQPDLSLQMEASYDIQPRLSSINVSPIWFDESLPLTPDGRTLAGIIRRVRRRRKIYLSSSIILPWPWHHERLVRTLCDIGKGRPEGSWKEDPNNHDVVMWLPLAIAWVCGGNHSITAGIAQARGVIRVREIYDTTPIYNHVRCDGQAFIRIHDGERLAAVRSPQAAAIFEIGRLMTRHQSKREG